MWVESSITRDRSSPLLPPNGKTVLHNYRSDLENPPLLWDRAHDKNVASHLHPSYFRNPSGHLGPSSERSARTRINLRYPRSIVVSAKICLIECYFDEHFLDDSSSHLALNTDCLRHVHPALSLP